MTVAFGTSMPSSTTVVATSTSGAPPANARSVSSFASAVSAAVQQADARRPKLRAADARAARRP